MMLCKLSLKNIKKSIKDYAIYFFTLILGVAIFYVFNSLDSQTVMMNVSASTKDIIKLMTEILSGVSVFVSFILGFLIIYASQFLIKRRNQEFGIYLTLGISKKKISTILLLETIFIGIISLGVGLGLGILLSQLMSILVANMFEADLTNFAFTFSSSACLKTLIYFGIMYLFVMIFNTINISRCKLIDLLYGSKKSEKIKLKNPVMCTIIFLISSVVLGYAYYLVTGGIEQIQEAQQIFIPIIMGAVSTFFIFWSLSGLLIKIITSIKKVYYKGLNSFTIRQISSKINTTVFSMTVICLMLFVTICVLSSALSIKNSMTANLTKQVPIDIEFYKRIIPVNENNENYLYYDENYIKFAKKTSREALEELGFDVDKYLQDIVEVTIYQAKDISIKDTIGTYYQEAKQKYPNLIYEVKEDFIKISDYNKAAKLLGQKQFSLNDNEYILLADNDNWISIREEGLKRNIKIQLLDRNYQPKYQENQKGFIHLSSSHANMGLFIVPDNAVDESLKDQSILLANYKNQSKAGKLLTEEQVTKLANNPYSINANTKISIYESSIGLGAMVTFIGLYLGIIFLISSAAILALKELSESSDNKERFKMLRKIGADEKIINKALFRQIAIFFLFPLCIAIIHSIFGIMFCNYILENLGNEKLLESIIMTAIFLIIIYGGYFIITYMCSKNIIKERWKLEMLN